jgi:hypothetical protein
MMTLNFRALLAAVLATLVLLPAAAADRSGSDTNPGAQRGAAQRRAAEEFLAALASGDTQAIARTIHEDELAQVRRRLVDEMKLEADRNESAVRVRLFGAGMLLSEIERMTPQNFFIALSSRLRIRGRPFARVDWLDAVGDSGGMVQMVGRLIPRTDEGNVRVPVLVSIVPWGKDWKAAFPLDWQAQIDDLRAGRVNAPGTAVVAQAQPGTTPAPSPATPGAAAGAGDASNPNPKAVLELFDDAVKNLKDKDCDGYYRKQMSPNFRATTSSKALRALIQTCENREAWREQTITALTLARGRAPRFEFQGNRAVYDLSRDGLPYPALVLEQVNKHWYIAE